MRDGLEGIAMALCQAGKKAQRCRCRLEGKFICHDRGLLREAGATTKALSEAGYAAVPKVPTDGMVDAGFSMLPVRVTDDQDEAELAAAFTAMINAYEGGE